MLRIYRQRRLAVPRWPDRRRQGADPCHTWPPMGPVTAPSAEGRARRWRFRQPEAPQRVEGVRAGHEKPCGAVGDRPPSRPARRRTACRGAPGPHCGRSLPRRRYARHAQVLIERAMTRPREYIGVPSDASIRTDGLERARSRALSGTCQPRCAATARRWLAPSVATAWIARPSAAPGHVGRNRWRCTASVAAAVRARTGRAFCPHRAPGLSDPARRRRAGQAGETGGP